jgi:serine/threonine protein kinase
MPVEIGSGRSAKAYLGIERWAESRTGFRREVVIKVLQRGVSEWDHLRFQMEKELLERLQGHPSIVRLYASGEADDPEFVPAPIRAQVEGEFLVLERLDMSLEELLKGSRDGRREDLLALDARDRIFQALDLVIPVASAVEYAHLQHGLCHRDIKPANVLLGRARPGLKGAPLRVRLADFNTANIRKSDVDFKLTRVGGAGVPGTAFFQSPEQETNVLDLLVTVEQGSDQIEYFEDFYIAIAPGDTFSVVNKEGEYTIVSLDRAKKRIRLGVAYRGVSEVLVRGTVHKSVGRPADVYAIGALLYHLVSGATANPKALYDEFHKFIEYDAEDESNTIGSYLTHQYAMIESLRAPTTAQPRDVVAPRDRFFSFKAFLDGNGELIDPRAMSVIARCMIRNKKDSYCQAHELDTCGVQDLVRDLLELYAALGSRFGARAFGRPSGPQPPARASRRSLLRWLERALRR